MKIAVLGPKGTFSEKSALEYVKNNNLDAELIFFNSIDETVRALKDSSFAMSIVPLENSLDGYVQRTLDLLLEERVYIVEETKLPIHYKLVSKCNKNDIKRIYVQFKAQGQCNNVINSINNVEIINTQSNVISDNQMVEDNKYSASIVPLDLEVNENYFVYNNCEDIEDNLTRFIILKNGKKIIDKVKKDEITVPMYICPNDDKPGILFEILKTFAELNLNLASIISRPTKKAFRTYNFYIEIKTSSSNYDTTLEAIVKLKHRYDIKVLGIY